jgi:hypothetical protein
MKTRCSARNDCCKCLLQKSRSLPSTFVSSFNLRTGAVLPQPGDYTAADVGADPAGAAAAVGAAILGEIGQPNGIAGLNALGEISDTTHGARGGGALHALATPLVAGFISGPDKAKLNRQAATQTVLVVKPPNAGESVTTRAPGGIFEGSVIAIPFPATVSGIQGRLTALTTIGAGLRVALFQIPGGGLNGNMVRLATANFTSTATGAQSLSLPFGASVDLEPGYAFLWYGRRNATTGLTLRVWTIPAQQGLNSVVPAGQTPLNFLTGQSSLVIAPPTFLTTSLVGSTVNPAWLGRFILCPPLITPTWKLQSSLHPRVSSPRRGSPSTRSCLHLSKPLSSRCQSPLTRGNLPRWTPTWPTSGS